MPINIGQVGVAGPAALPFRHKPVRNLFRSPKFSTSNTKISGVTRDSANAPVANCRVELFMTFNDMPLLTTTSDGSGNYNFDNPGSGPFYIIAYKAGSPDVSGTTVNTLVAT
jgi:hypothetical protein